MNIPEVITVRATVSYTKEELVKSLEFLDIEATPDNIMTLADHWANEDFGDIDYVFLDADGNPLHA